MRVTIITEVSSGGPHRERRALDRAERMPGGVVFMVARLSPPVYLVGETIR